MRSVIKNPSLSAMFPILLFVVLIINSCYYDKQEELYQYSKLNTCDTMAFSFNVKVKPIFQNYCMGCHNAVTARGGVILENYDGVKNVAQNGRLFGAISRNAGFVPMPKDAPKLSECNITLIRKWIENGMLNN